MSETAPASVTAGVLVAVLGLIPLGWFLTRPSADEVVADAATTTIAIEELERTPIEVAPPTVPELDESISRVLYSAGNANAVGEANAGLPPEVVRVLVYYDVTLMVPIDGATQGETP